MSVTVDETFHWNYYDSPIEDVARYRLGGYHPVKLGDCFSTFPTTAAPSSSSPNLSSSESMLPRYRILHKLGYGSFATVWLARDLLPPGRFVALKITVADFQAGNHEARILKLLAYDSTVNIEGSQHVLSLLDNFQIQGPNGTHEVFVTEVVASLSDFKRYPEYNNFRKSFAHQALQGVAYLHSRGIAHGDLHFDNLGCTLPGLNERTELDLLGHFGNPECVTPILAVNPGDQTVSLPPYLIPAISMAEYLVKAKPPLSFETELPLLKILDFGGSYQQGEARPHSQCAVGICPPETVFPMIALEVNDPYWDMQSDIWSLGCTIYEIITGCEFFYGIGARGLIGRMARLFGEVPPLWASYWASNKYLKDQEISAARASAEWMEYKPSLVAACKSEEEADRVIDLLRSMLVFDPAERPSVRQVMGAHRWLEPNNAAR